MINLQQQIEELAHAGLTFSQEQREEDHSSINVIYLLYKRDADYVIQNFESLAGMNLHSLEVLLRASLNEIPLSQFEGLETCKYELLMELQDLLLEGHSIEGYDWSRMDEEAWWSIGVAMRLGMNPKEWLEQGFQFDAISKIVLFVQKGVPAELLTKEVFDVRQIRQIGLGWLHGVEVARYAKKEYSPGVMDDFRIALETIKNIENSEKLEKE